MKRNIRIGDLVRHKEQPLYQGRVTGVSTIRQRRNGKRVTVHVVTVQLDLGVNSFLCCDQEELTVEECVTDQKGS